MLKKIHFSGYFLKLMRHPSLDAINQKLRHIPETRVIEKGPILITAHFPPASLFSHCLFWQPSIQWNELWTGHPTFSFRFSLSCNKLASVKVLEYYIIKLIFIINLQCWLTSLKDGFDDEYHGRPDWENRGSLVSHPHRFVQGIYLTNKEALTVLCSVIKHTGSG